MIIYLIRHGKTEANERHLYCGSTNLSLSETGLDELKACHYDLKNVCYITSGMRRTEQTLKVLFGEVPHTIDIRLREVDFGIFEMHSYEELMGDPRYQTWISGDNGGNIPPEGESGLQMTARVMDAFRDIQKSKLDTVVVTHGGVIAAIMQYLFPAESKNRYQWQPKPGCGYAIVGDSYHSIP